MTVWDEGTIGGLKTGNRFVHTATGEGLCTEKGEATPRLLERYRSLGRSGAVGLIVTGHMFVEKAGRMRPGQTGIHDDTLIRGLARVARAARQDGSKIFAQLAHGGIMTIRSVTGGEALGPSKITVNGSDDNRAMSLSEIHALIEHFAEAANRAQEAGFDGVQLHAAHGSGLSQFLSPYFNRREDEFGGSVENRTRIVTQILHRIQDVAGKDFPVTVKMNSMDFIPGGLGLEEAIQSAELLEKAGAKGLEVSGGGAMAGAASGPMRPVNPKTLKGACYFREQARIFQKRLNIPVTLVGGVRTLEQAEDVILSGDAGFVGICRPLIREPDLLIRWKQGVSSGTTCVSCNRCLALSRTETGVFCPHKLE